MGFNPFRVLRLLARIGRPLARILGLKKGTAVDKGIEVAEILDPVLPRTDKDGGEDTKPE